MTYAEIAGKLGGASVLRTDVHSEAGFVALVERGLPVESLTFMVNELAPGGVPPREVMDLVGKTRTLERKRAHAKTAQRKAGSTTRRTAPTLLRLSDAESDRLARLARMLVRTEHAFGDNAKALRWLAKPNRALRGKRPLTLLGTDAGTVAVERVLGRIEHGIYG